MGMYTCLKFTGELKEEFADDIKRLFHWETADREDVNYNEWEDFAKKYTFAKHFASLDRATMIPFGGFSAYNFDKVSSGDFLKESATFSNVLYPRTWVFQCDLKDYGDEVETFLEEIAPKICTKFIAEKWYEEDDFPTLYTYGLDENYSKKIL